MQPERRMAVAASGEVDLDLSRPSPPLSPPHLDLRSPPPSHSSPPPPPLLDLDLRDVVGARVSSSSVCLFAVGLFFCFNKQFFLLH